MYRGKVTAVDASGVYVQTAEYGTLGPCQAVVANYAVADMVLCVNVGDEASPELVVVGRLTGTGSAASGSSVDNTVARYDGTGGALQGSGVVIDDGGNLVAGGAASSHITIGAPKDTANADVGFRASGSNRWTIRRTADTESGSNAGSHLALIRRDDGGSAITPNVLQIYRDSGKIRIGSVGPTAGLEMGSGGPTWTVGTGVPSHSAPNGSLHSRTDGGSGTTLYVRESGSWVGK